MPRCPDPRCHAPEVACRLGEPTPSACPTWRRSNASGQPEDVRDDPQFIRLPWSGAALGTTDLAFLTARSEPKLVALIGPHNAGKTTLLGAWYQRIGRTGRVGAGSFAGSYSLEGWEAVAHALRWEGGAPRFPPHTSSGSGRAPGLLHLAFRGEDGELADHLFADTPGEWFQRWAVDASAPDAEGARWVMERAAALMLVADCEALSGAGRGQARSDLVNLARRVASERRGRPTALVWTKADVTVPPAIRSAVESAAKLVIPELAQFETSVVTRRGDGAEIDPMASVGAALDWATLPPLRGFEPAYYQPARNDPFFSLAVST